MVAGGCFVLGMSLLLLFLRLTQVQLRFDLLATGGVLRSHFFFRLLLLAGGTFVKLIVTGHSGRSRWVVEVTATGSFGSHLVTGVP